MKKEKKIEVLNSLITINNDRIEGYETASKATEEYDLKTLFAKFISTSQKCKKELEKEVITLDGEIDEGTNVSGQFFRKWMDVKAALTGKDRKAILNSCEYGEDKTLEAYDKVLDNDLEDLSVIQQTMVLAQKSLLKADHDHVKSMRDAMVEDA